MSLALARKYRPRRFADVAVQSHVASTLRNAIGSDRVAQAYLFCGPRGTGKTTLARVLAMALNCENRSADFEPCGACEPCTRIWGGHTSMDVVEIDAASNRGVDDARDLRSRAAYAPSGEKNYKVYIIDEAHMLTREAWNTLLKVLEEPPPRVVFVFATTEPQKIAQQAAPVLSRVQRFDLKRIGPADVRARLTTVLNAEGISAEADALGMLARAADGSMRDALSLTDQVLSLGGTVTTQGVRDALGLVHEDEYLALLDLDRLVLDLLGAFPVSEALQPTFAHRLIDTRTTGGPLVPSVDREVIAASDGAAMVTLTAVDPQGIGYLTARPCGTYAGTSVLNVVPNHQQSGSAIVSLATGLCVRSSVSTQVLVDSWGVAGSAYQAITPVRLLDTRL